MPHYNKKVFFLSINLFIQFPKVFLYSKSLLSLRDFIEKKQGQRRAKLICRIKDKVNGNK
jgi:hypothetical protein